MSREECLDRVRRVCPEPSYYCGWYASYPLTIIVARERDDATVAVDYREVVRQQNDGQLKTLILTRFEETK